ncbi:hypothetical protein D0Y65_047736 [Glycine soja]|uniref:Uncharacterized protein n=1 Tax=Glycine soja TaxID=3848 RepID=A0A445FQ72_GLYSO|nr:hypothetical protein D0Y65_047736 [Glycine soja]
MKHKAYTILMALMLTAVGINHVVASTAEMSLPTTIFIFHVSGIVACQTLMWVLVSEILWWYIINVLVLLVASFCFNYKDITELIRGTRHPPN